MHQAKARRLTGFASTSTMKDLLGHAPTCRKGARNAFDPAWHRRTLCRHAPAIFRAGARRRPAKIHRRAARPDAGAHRPVSRRIAGAGADGDHLPQGCRRSCRVGARQPQPERRRRRQGGTGQAVGPQRAVAGRLPAGTRHAQRKTRMGARSGRCLSRPAEGRHGFGAVPARQGQGVRQPEHERTADRHRRTGAATAANRRRQRPAAADADHHHRPGQPASRLRADLQPGACLRPVVAPAVSALLLPAGTGLGIRLEPGRHRHLVGRRHRHHQRTLGWRQLGPARRQHQRQSLEQHQRQ